jgi:hypothetical protein
MVDQGLAAPFLVAAAVLAYGLGVASLFLLQSAARRRTRRARAAARLRTITRWVDAGRLAPFHKTPGLRGMYLFTADEVERFAAEQEQSA